MPLRKLLIWIMLWALGLTAVVGAATALVYGFSDASWKLLGTGIATAVSAALLIPFSILADKPKTRAAGTLGMALVIAEFGGTLGLIWDVFDALGDWELEQRVGLTMVTLALTGLPAVFMLYFAGMGAGRIAGMAGIALCATVFVLVMVSFWTQSPHDDEWFETAMALAGTGVAGVACLAGVGTPPRRHWRWIGVAASALAAVAAVYAVWKTVHSGSELFIIVLTIAIVLAHANLCLFVPLAGAQKWVRVITISAGVATAIAIDVLAIADEHRTHVPGAENLAAAGGIITACGSLALLVLARVNRNLDRVPVLSEIKQITIICPGCQRRQTLPVGASSCATCGLKFTVQLEEPRCPKCDYLLFMLQSDRCPECGEPLRPAGSAAAGAIGNLAIKDGLS
jgi:hypothetical protein